MRVNSLLNKIEIFQDFYFEVNGVKISYNEAVKLFYRMDEETENSFFQYYIDKVEYELVDQDGNFISPFVSPSGYGLEPKIEVTGSTDNDGNTVHSGESTRKRKKDRKTGEYRAVHTWDTNTSDYTKNLIEQQYNLLEYARRNGFDIDSEWGKYSAEEIIQMEENGVNIPQEVLDVAHSIVESDPENYEGGDEVDNGEADLGEEDKRQETFLELIPDAKKHIEKCEEKTDKIDDKIDDLIQDTKHNNQDMLDKIEEQKTSLKEYEELIREWRYLQNKVNSGETLSDREARRYAEITGMLEDRNNNSDEFKLDKNKIAINLNEINILAVLGEQLADETIEIGEELSDYTSKKNYKATARDTMGQIGFFKTIIAMFLGKRLGQEAVKTGNETKEYTEESADAIQDVAELLGVDKLLVDPSAQAQAPVEEAQQDMVEDAQQEIMEEPVGEEPSVDENKETENEAQHENETVEEDFIINDKNVLDLIDEVYDIDVDLLKQIKVSLLDLKNAKDDANFAKNAINLIEKMVKEYQEEEAKRQEEIETKEQENEEAQKRIEELGGGKNAEEGKSLAEEYGVDAENENQDEIDEQQAIIDQNTQDIEALNEESVQATEEIKNRTQPMKEKIDKAVVDETKALENDTKYKEEIIPEDMERVDFTENSGKTLTKMGKYRVVVGTEYLTLGLMTRNPYWIHKGTKHIVKGTISMGIGAGAVLVSNTQIPELSDKSTNLAVKQEDKALTSLGDLDAKIIEVTGEESAEDQAQELVDEDEAGSAEAGSAESEDGSVEAGNSNAIDDLNSVQDETSSEISENTKGQIVSEDEVTQSAESTDNTDENTDESSDENIDDGDVSSSGPSKSKKKDEEMTTDDAQKYVDKTADTASQDSKESEKLEKDTDKDSKQLEKEVRKLQKQMKKDEKDIIRMIKESMEAAKKQEELMTRYEELTNENDTIAAEEENKRSQAPAAQQPQNAQPSGMVGASNSFGVIDSSQSSSSDNAAKMEANNQEITVISGQFNIAGNKINRNRTKIVKLEKTTKKNQKKINKKFKIRDKKIKESEKKEQDKQKRLTKQLAAVGAAENLFTITETTGLTMIAIGMSMTVGGGPLISAGTVLKVIGLYGMASCAVTKAIINVANGNLTAALVGLGTAAVKIASSFAPGVGNAAGSVLGYVSNGLSIVASSAELVNNVRTLEGKEASGAMSKLATIAGVGSAVTSAASSLSNLGSQGTFGKIATIASATGTAMTSTSQLMNEFGWGDEKTANMLGSIGGAISTVASVAQLAAPKKSDSSDNNGDENKVDTPPEGNGSHNPPEGFQGKPDSANPNILVDGSGNRFDTKTGQMTDKNGVKIDPKTKQPLEQKNTDSNDAQAAAKSEEGVGSLSESPVITNSNSSTPITAEQAVANVEETQLKTTETQQVHETLNQENTQTVKEGEKAEQSRAEKKAQENSKLTDEEKKNMLKNGASEEFKDVNDEQLDEKIKTAEEALPQEFRGMNDEQLTEQIGILEEQAKSSKFVDIDDKDLQARIDELSVKNSENSITTEEQAELNEMEAEQKNRDKLSKAKDLDKLRKEKTEREKYKEQMKKLEDNSAWDKVSKVTDIAGQALNVVSTIGSMFASDDKTDNKNKGVAPSGSQYIHNSRFKAIASSNDSYFGGGHNDDQKRRFKKFAKRV